MVVLSDGQRVNRKHESHEQSGRLPCDPFLALSRKAQLIEDIGIIGHKHSAVIPVPLWFMLSRIGVRNMSTNSNTFGEKVRLQRGKMGWTQDDLAQAAKLSQSEVCKVEKGRVKDVTKETVGKLAVAFNVDPGRLALGTPFAHFFGESDTLPTGTLIECPPIMAYFASALTGLDDTQLAELKELDQTVEAVCNSYDRYPVVLYRPRLTTSPQDNPLIADRDVYEIDSGRVASSDILILAAIFPSLGAGMELQMAYDCCTPVILLTKNGIRLSKMATGCPVRKKVVTYGSIRELPERLADGLNEIIPIIAEHRLGYEQSDNESEGLSLGQRIRHLRAELHDLTEADLARMVGVDTACIEYLESKPEQISNPSLRLLKKIARALLTSDSYILTGYAPPIHLTNPIFSDHLQQLKSLSREIEMAHEEFEQIWSEHVDEHKKDLSVIAGGLRVGTKDYWVERHESFKAKAAKGNRLF